MWRRLLLFAINASDSLWAKSLQKKKLISKFKQFIMTAVSSGWRQHIPLKHRYHLPTTQCYIPEDQKLNPHRCGKQIKYHVKHIWISSSCEFNPLNQSRYSMCHYFQHIYILHLAHKLYSCVVNDNHNIRYLRTRRNLTTPPSGLKLKWPSSTRLHDDTTQKTMMWRDVM